MFGLDNKYGVMKFLYKLTLEVTIINRIVLLIYDNEQPPHLQIQSSIIFKTHVDSRKKNHYILPHIFGQIVGDIQAVWSG